MIKMLTLLLAISLGVIGCGLLNTNGAATSGLTTTFTISDTTGRTASVFLSGEPFLLSFALVNNTGDTFTAHFPPMPPVKFEILRGDSVVVYSNPKPTGPIIAVPNYIIEAMFLEPLDTLHTQWMAPDTPYENSAIVLAPGSYSAEVSFPSYGKAILDTVRHISFSVVQ